MTFRMTWQATKSDTKIDPGSESNMNFYEYQKIHKSSKSFDHPMVHIKRSEYSQKKIKRSVIIQFTFLYMDISYMDMIS